MDITNLRYIEKYAQNPLVEPQEIKTKQKTVRPIGTGNMVDTITGEVMAGTAVVVRQTVDEEHFVKVFQEGIKAAYDLTPAGYKTFQIVLKATQAEAVGADKIYLHFMDAVEDPDMPISRQTFHKGLKELLAKGFVAASDRPSIFWINPHLFFKGDRVAFVKEYVRRKNNGDEEVRNELEKRGQGRLIE